MIYTGCGGCGRRIWFWQKVEFHDLRANPWRRAMLQRPFHPRCWKDMPESAK